MAIWPQGQRPCAWAWSRLNTGPYLWPQRWCCNCGLQCYIKFLSLIIFSASVKRTNQVVLGRLCWENACLQFVWHSIQRRHPESELAKGDESNHWWPRRFLWQWRLVVSQPRKWCQYCTLLCIRFINCMGFVLASNLMLHEGAQLFVSLDIIHIAMFWRHLIR